MNSLFDRLGLYDFFNVIVAGGIVLLYSIGMLDKWCILFVDSWIMGLFLLLLAYVLGMICQEIGRLITETWLRIKDKQIEHMLESKDKIEENLEDTLKIDILKREKIKSFLAKQIQVTNNKYKVHDYKKYIEKITKDFEEKNVPYAFAYCIYYIRNLGKDQKVEKMRALYGMAQNLVGTGVMIVISGVFISLYLEQVPSGKVIICSLVVAILLVLIGLMRVFVYSKHMIRMTMGVYQVCLENDK